MNNLLLFMTFSGTIAFVCYHVFKIFFRDKLSAGYRYILLKVVMAFYLLPFPLLANDCRILLGHLFNNENIVTKIYEKTNIEKIYYVSKEGISLPFYRNTTLFFISIWVIAACIILLQNLMKYKNLKQSIKNSFKKMEFNLELPDNKVRQLVQKKKINFYKSSEVPISFTYGLKRPTIILADEKDENAKKLIALHELEHIQSKDFLVRMLGLAIIAIHFYNPMVYLLSREINQVSELHCDEQVIKNISDQDRKHYGHLIIEEARQVSDAVLFSFFSNKNERGIKERIHMIKKPITKKIMYFLLTVVLMIMVGFVPVLGYAVPAPFYVNSLEPKSKGETIEILEGDFEIPLDEKTFAQSDEYYISEDDIIITDLSPKITKARCIHSYVRGTYKKHIRKRHGGCKVKVYSCKRCKKCMAYKNIVIQSSHTYKTCPH